MNKEDLLCIEIVEEIGQKLGKQIAGDVYKRQINVAAPIRAD